MKWKLPFHFPTCFGFDQQVRDFCAVGGWPGVENYNRRLAVLRIPRQERINVVPGVRVLFPVSVREQSVNTSLEFYVGIANSNDGL